MANEAMAMPIDPQVVDFFSQLSYLRGYKSALFDAKIRFQTAEKDVLKRWTQELEAVTRLTNYFSNIMVQNSRFSLADVESYLLDALAVDKTDLRLTADGVEAMRHTVEKALGILVEIKRSGVAGEAEAA